ncbi:MAG TPA: YicC/YloC family endoribonuclease [Limnochordales bacterium]
MLRSMTGYGRAVASAGDRTATVEVRSVNHRFLDLAVRLPRSLMGLEERVRAVVQEQIQRGRIEISVTVEEHGPGDRRVRIDRGLLLALRAALEEARDVLQTPEPVSLSHVLGFPDVLQVEEPPADLDGWWAVVRPALAEALAGVASMRAREGQALAADIAARIEQLRTLAQQVQARAPVVVREVAARLAQRLAELVPQGVDPQRLAQEVALIADRSDVSEELARVMSHLTQLQALVDASGPAGRKMDFLVQELNREWNTIGSKSGDAQISQWVVEAKAELEKIREQVQNIE